MFTKGLPVKLNKKTVLLTGASTGIGRGIAKTLLAKGARVIVFGQNKPPYCSSFYKVDVGNERQIISALSEVGKIDILINNAGVSIDAAIEDTTNQIMDKILDVNLKGLFWMAKHSIPKIKRGGCIVNISSLCAFRSFAGTGIYSATKAAVTSMTEILAQELAGRKIRVNALAPGVIDTAIWDKKFGRRAGKMLKGMTKSTLLKRLGTPEDMAHAVVFLCENEFIDGSTIIVDGGERVGGG